MEGRRVVADIECDNLLREVTRIHCVSYQWEDETEVKSITDPKRIKKFFQQENVTFVGHNFQTYDLAVVKKLLGIEIPYTRVIDTLALSWHLYEERILHGLESWGKDFNTGEEDFLKVEITDWRGITQEEEDYLNKGIVDEEYERIIQKRRDFIDLMTRRCERDVKINMQLWLQQKALLEELYEGDEKIISKLQNYLSFKLDCVREQEEVGLRLDLPRIHKGIEKLTELAENKVNTLKEVMPKIPIITQKTKPKKFLNKDGEVTALGQKWLDLLGEKGISEDYEGTIEVLQGHSEPNPNSTSQVKSWLFSLGWHPEHIKYDRNKKTNEVKEIPQIVGKIDKTEVCPSIKKLFAKEPALEELNGLGIIQHRLGILKGFLRDKIDGRIYASASSVTSTMRLKHKVLVNLPATSAPYAEDIRASLVASDGCVLLGADINSAEDMTKRHLIYRYDPEYVLEQSTPGFDPHLDIAVRANLMSQEDADFYKLYDKSEDKSKFNDEDKNRFKKLKLVRHKAKTTNFSATYKIKSKALARALDIKEKESQKLLDGFWERNKAVLQYEEDCSVKNINGRNWIQNPVSKFWLPLRNDKDKLSATNQSLAVYVFDCWLMFLRNQGVRVNFQSHDELVVESPEKDVERITEIIKASMVKVNQALKLNVTMGCSVDVGKNYAETH